MNMCDVLWAEFRLVFEGKRSVFQGGLEHKVNCK